MRGRLVEWAQVGTKEDWTQSPDSATGIVCLDTGTINTEHLLLTAVGLPDPEHSSSAIGLSTPL